MDNVNLMARNCTVQVRSIVLASSAVASGDFTQKVELDVRGEMLALNTTLDAMTEILAKC
jgi:nitrogen fixation/metabolism regulation signal transduction histidine kinase